MSGTLERPPAVSGEYSCWLPCSPKAPSAARMLLRTFLARTTGGDRYAETGELLLSELVTNAVRHGRVPGRLIWVWLQLDVGSLRLEVHDASSNRPTVHLAVADEECGRGLWLVDQLSVRWGCCPRAGGVGKVVWAVVGPAVRGAE